MITFLTKKGFEYTVTEFLKNAVAQPVRDHIKVVPYFRIKDLIRHPHHVIIFTDHERFSPSEKRAAISVYNFLGSYSSDLKTLNDPAGVLVRLPLLNELHRRGINEYNAYSPAADFTKLRFPVFIRSSYDHHGSISEFLQTPEEVKAAVKKLAFPYTKYPGKDLMIVEFCNTADQDGFFRKYDAYKINGKILPSSMGKSKYWGVKARYNLKTRERYLEHREYIKTNPFREELDLIFQIANIDYGRIDFALSRNKIQVWEINTNPMIDGWQYNVEHIRKTLSPDALDVWESARNMFYTALVSEFCDMLESKPVCIDKIPEVLIKNLQWTILNSRIRRRFRSSVSKTLFKQHRSERQ